MLQRCTLTLAAGLSLLCTGSALAQTAEDSRPVTESTTGHASLSDPDRGIVHDLYQHHMRESTRLITRSEGMDTASWERDRSGSRAVEHMIQASRARQLMRSAHAGIPAVDLETWRRTAREETGPTRTTRGEEHVRTAEIWTRASDPRVQELARSSRTVVENDVAAPRTASASPVDYTPDIQVDPVATETYPEPAASEGAPAPGTADIPASVDVVLPEDTPEAATEPGSIEGMNPPADPEALEAQPPFSSEVEKSAPADDGQPFDGEMPAADPSADEQPLNEENYQAPDALIQDPSDDEATGIDEASPADQPGTLETDDPAVIQEPGASEAEPAPADGEAEAAPVDSSIDEQTEPSTETTPADAYDGAPGEAPSDYEYAP